MKVYKFVKDEEEREKTYAVLLKYYVEMKDRFINCIGKRGSYPSIDWLDFGNICKTWQIEDKNLSSKDIDIIFKATNFEEEDLEENDDSSLCRYEFFEIITRMAKCKYLDPKLVPSMSESLEKLITEFIIPNSIEKMDC